MFNIFKRKPSLKATLINQETQVKMRIRNSNAQQAILLAYLTVCQVAKALKMQDRELMNKLLDLDRTIEKQEKSRKKMLYRQEQEVKHKHK